ncbi:hypothetical protein P7K49_025811 [Saguinus oedipus]|uniref:Uncharacterized protein n=1 Tax=Saguinus oedipus TaxID=9490 RepID=A0ABQ9UI88_SAGOE|nr:hypothetical protein P7K49_025811 [Saguinus oedipus]
MREQGHPSSSAPAYSDPDLAKLPSCPDPAMVTRLLCWPSVSQEQNSQKLELPSPQI